MMLSASVNQHFTGKEKTLPLFMQDPLQKRAISGRGSHHKMFFSENIAVVHDEELSRSQNKTEVWRVK